jgi:hypothetical protein
VLFFCCSVFNHFIPEIECRNDNNKILADFRFVCWILHFEFYAKKNIHFKKTLMIKCKSGLPEKPRLLLVEKHLLALMFLYNSQADKQRINFSG